MKNTKIIYCISADSDVLARAHWVLQRTYQILMFEDVEAALASLDQGKPELIIVDTDSAEFDINALVSATKKDCGDCISYLMLSASTRRAFSSLFRCNCIVGQVSLPLIPEQLQSAVSQGMELSHMCQIRAKLFSTPLPADRIELVMQA